LALGGRVAFASGPGAAASTVETVPGASGCTVFEGAACEKTTDDSSRMARETPTRRLPQILKNGDPMSLEFSIAATLEFSGVYRTFAPRATWVLTSGMTEVLGKNAIGVFAFIPEPVAFS
jgi:hypothetical protein